MAGERDDDLRRRMRAFIDERVIPQEPVLARDDDASAAAIERLKEEAKAAGLWALGHPAEIGGGGVGLVVLRAPQREHRALGVGPARGREHLDAGRDHAAPYGTEEQRERWLLPMVRGELLPSVALTEPEVAGSDPTLIRARAEQDGDEWVLDGHKWFVTGADRAAYTTVFCRTEPDETPPHRAMTMVIVPAGTPGLEIVRRDPDDGPHRRLALRAAARPASASRWRTPWARAGRPSGSRRTASGRGGSSTPCAGSARRSGRSS